jgi:hypothetical protein
MRAVTGPWDTIARTVAREIDILDPQHTIFDGFGELNKWEGRWDVPDLTHLPQEDDVLEMVELRDVLLIEGVSEDRHDLVIVLRDVTNIDTYVNEEELSVTEMIEVLFDRPLHCLQDSLTLLREEIFVDRVEA